MTDLEMYNQLCKASEYEIYFLLNKKLYRYTLKHITSDLVKYDHMSSKRGGHKTLRLRITKAIKNQLVYDNQAKYVMTEENFLQLKTDLNLNKGETCEYLSDKKRNLAYARNNTPFYECGDINMKRKSIQVKFENATLCVLNQLSKCTA